MIHLARDDPRSELPVVHRRVLEEQFLLEGPQDASAIALDGLTEGRGASHDALGGSKLRGDAPGRWVAEEGRLSGEEGVARDVEGLVEEREDSKLGRTIEERRRDVRVVAGLRGGWANATRRTPLGHVVFSGLPFGASRFFVRSVATCCR